MFYSAESGDFIPGVGSAAASDAVSDFADLPLFQPSKTSRRDDLLSYLVSYTSIAVEDASGAPCSAVVNRFFLQALARELLPGERVADCMRAVAYGFDTVAVKTHVSREKAKFGHLAVCGSVWTCPVCATRITEQRRAELSGALARSPYQALLVTYTFSHKITDPIEKLLDVLRESRRDFKRNTFWKRIQAAYKVVGTIGALEVPWGANGWHPHIHELLFLDRRLDVGEILSLQEKFRAEWLHVLAKHGGKALRQIGVDIRSSDIDIADYVAKFGHEPTYYAKKWKIEHELTKSPSKNSRNKQGGCSPHGLLRAYGSGHSLAGDLYREYAEAFKGRNQLNWSKGLKALLGVDEVLDEEIVQADEPGYFVLTELPASTWYKLLRSEKRNALRGQLLEVAKEGDVDKLWAWLETMGVSRNEQA